MITPFHLQPRVNGSHEKKLAGILSTGKVERALACSLVADRSLQTTSESLQMPLTLGTYAYTLKTAHKIPRHYAHIGKNPTHLHQHLSIRQMTRELKQFAPFDWLPPYQLFGSGPPLTPGSFPPLTQWNPKSNATSYESSML